MRASARGDHRLVVPALIAWQILATTREGAQPARAAMESSHLPRLIDEDGARPESHLRSISRGLAVTLGVCYERIRIRRASYKPIVRGALLLNAPLQNNQTHEARNAPRADERVAAVMAKLKQRGFVSPYLPPSSSRESPVRWIRASRRRSRSAERCRAAGKFQYRESEAGRPRHAVARRRAGLTVDPARRQARV